MMTALCQYHNTILAFDHIPISIPSVHSSVETDCISSFNPVPTFDPRLGSTRHRMRRSHHGLHRSCDDVARVTSSRSHEAMLRPGCSLSYHHFPTTTQNKRKCAIIIIILSRYNLSCGARPISASSVRSRAVRAGGAFCDMADSPAVGAATEVFYRGCSSASRHRPQLRLGQQLAWPSL
jgi:hypothetical protein